MNHSFNTKKVETIIGYKFKDKALLKRALTHSSAIMDNPELLSYERLEYLGDAVLDLLVTTLLYKTYTDKSEGWMTKVRASIVSESPLAQIAKELDLGQCLILGKGTENAGGRELHSILSDSIEAIIGALYIDGGIAVAEKFIIPFMAKKLAESIKQGKYFDYKTSLQELLQQNGNISIKYELLKEEGPPHDRVFTTQVLVDGKEMGKGQGKSKKISQQNAARKALEEINHE
ncbi:MAG: ribonuclease III [Clostridia bacterium]|nr:ribonuclease III [Clostridia bacterium]